MQVGLWSVPLRKEMNRYTFECIHIEICIGLCVGPLYAHNKHNATCNESVVPNMFVACACVIANSDMHGFCGQIIT